MTGYWCITTVFSSFIIDPESFSWVLSYSLYTWKHFTDVIFYCFPKGTCLLAVYQFSFSFAPKLALCRKIQSCPVYPFFKPETSFLTGKQSECCYLKCPRVAFQKIFAVLLGQMAMFKLCLSSYKQYRITFATLSFHSFFFFV